MPEDDADTKSSAEPHSTARGSSATSGPSPEAGF